MQRHLFPYVHFLLFTLFIKTPRCLIHNFRHLLVRFEHNISEYLTYAKLFRYSVNIVNGLGLRLMVTWIIDKSVFFCPTNSAGNKHVLFTMSDQRKAAYFLILDHENIRFLLTNTINGYRNSCRLFFLWWNWLMVSLLEI